MSTDKPEGLFYGIKRWEQSRLPLDAPVEDILHEFLGYVVAGVKDGNTFVQALDGSGGMNGVINWLAGYRNYKANFYIAFQPTLMLFVSLDNGSKPWNEICGFMEFVKKLEVDLSLDALTLQARKDLDDELAKMKPRTERLLEILSYDKGEELLAALRGEKGHNIDEVLERLEPAEMTDGLGNLFKERRAAFASLADRESRDTKEGSKEE
jgi:hypothetical protein